MMLVRAMQIFICTLKCKYHNILLRAIEQRAKFDENSDLEKKNKTLITLFYKISC